MPIEGSALSTDCISGRRHRLTCRLVYLDRQRLEGRGLSPVDVVKAGMAVPGIGELNHVIFDELLADDRMKVVGNTARVISVSGPLSSWKGQLASLKAGPFEHQQMGVREGSLTALGLEYLSRFSVVLDYPRNRLYLSPGKRFHASTAFDMSGMALVRTNGQTIVQNVHAGTPAATAGIQKGDHITHINNVAVSSVSLLDVRRRLAQPDGEPVHMTFQRGDVTTHCVLTMENWQFVDIHGQVATYKARARSRESILGKLTGDRVRKILTQDLAFAQNCS